MPSTSWCAYSYSYTVESRFCPAIGFHFFKLRAIPAESECQRLVEHHIELSPDCRWSHSVDGQGNRVQYGGFEAEHALFRVESHGVVECRPYRIPEALPNEIYRFPSPLTAPLRSPQGVRTLPDAILAADGSYVDRSATALAVMHWVHAQLVYTPCVTSNATTANEALHLGQGVCQDYAHVMIACCRSLGLYARYACGLIPGEGATHAWVEVYDGEAWLGYDPTHDCQIETGYIKLAHGRDASDCPLNRGRIYGWTSESLTVTCSVTQVPPPPRPSMIL